MSACRTLWRILLFVLLTIGTTAPAQTIDQQRAGVVRVTAVQNGLPKTGTGFIVRLDADAAYILTASHVVEGDPRPRVEFYTRQNLLVETDAVRLEGGDPRGLALLVVRGKDKLAPGLSALPLAEGASLTGGESVVAIGFPQGGGPWAIVPATVGSRVGRDITLAGVIDEGNSGGPVFSDGAVVAVVVQERGKFGVAVPAAIVKLTVEGWGVQPAGSLSPPSNLRVVPDTAVPPSPAPLADTASEPTPAGAGSVQDVSVRVLEQHIAAYKRNYRVILTDRDYPRQARQNGWEGQAVVRVRIGNDGKILALDIASSSGHKVLDDRALEIVKRSRIPPLPPELTGREFSVEVPVSFRLVKE